MRLVDEYATFCEVRVLACRVQGDELQVIVEVPPRPPVPPAGEEVLRRLDAVSCVRSKAAVVARRLARFRRAGDEEGERDYLATFHRQMWDLSTYMKAVKQQFGAWRNRRFGNTGSQWAGCFRSTVLEPGVAHALASTLGQRMATRSDPGPTPDQGPSPRSPAVAPRPAGVRPAPMPTPPGPPMEASRATTWG